MAAIKCWMMKIVQDRFYFYDSAVEIYIAGHNPFETEQNISYNDEVMDIYLMI